MNPAALVVLAILSLISAGCASTPGSAGAPPASVAGEWLGTTTVGPKINCCFGSPGAVRLMLEQTGGTMTGTLVGVGFRGQVSGIVSEKGLSGSCRCATRQQESDIAFEGSIAGTDMVFRISDAIMTLTHTQ